MPSAITYSATLFGKFSLVAINSYVVRSGMADLVFLAQTRLTQKLSGDAQVLSSLQITHLPLTRAL